MGLLLLRGKSRLVIFSFSDHLKFVLSDSLGKSLHVRERKTKLLLIGGRLLLIVVYLSILAGIILAVLKMAKLALEVRSFLAPKSSFFFSFAEKALCLILGHSYRCLKVISCSLMGLRKC